MTPKQTAHMNISTLKIAFNQLSEATSERSINERLREIESILTTLKFDAKDLAEDRIAEFEKMDYVPSF